MSMPRLHIMDWERVDQSAGAHFLIRTHGKTEMVTLEIA